MAQGLSCNVLGNYVPKEEPTGLYILDKSQIYNVFNPMAYQATDVFSQR